MRVLILILIFLVPLSSHSFALSNGQLYQYCKPFADRAFEGKTTDDLMCVSYFRGVADSGLRNCGILKDIIARPDVSTEQKAVFNAAMLSAGLGFTDGEKLKPAIQLFVNEMATVPEKWDAMAIWVAHSSIQKVAPCE